MPPSASFSLKQSYDSISIRGRLTGAGGADPEDLAQETSNMIVTQMSPSGVLFYSTLLGGSINDTSGGIAIDSTGSPGTLRGSGALG